ncbi:hypothetical protein GOODEAATRI_002474 [Goodea atripinnis]|uniref:Uncharacterized protein n=1 Tax=Goodea atripinnis TaxID=208336 RepID=A0ABV0NGW3_9TELE
MFWSQFILTLSKAVPQTELPGLQGLPAVEAQQSRLVQAQDGQSKSHTFIPLSRFSWLVAALAPADDPVQEADITLRASQGAPRVTLRKHVSRYSLHE